MAISSNPTDNEARKFVADANGDVTVRTTLASGDINIGNVDVVSVPAPLNVSGGGTEASALRVTLANDSTGVLSVDDNGGSLTIDGTVTTNQIKSSTGTHSNITVAATSTVVLASNANRIGLAIKNNGTADIFLNFGGTAVTTNYPVSPGEEYLDSGNGVYTGAINGIVASGTENARVVEFT